MQLRQEESRKARDKELASSSQSSSSSSTTTAAAAALTKRTDIYGESSGAALDDGKLKRALEKDDEWRKQDHSEEADDRRRGGRWILRFIFVYILLYIYRNCHAKVRCQLLHSHYHVIAAVQSVKIAGLRLSLSWQIPVNILINKH